jgi:hypothetical protein
LRAHLALGCKGISSADFRWDNSIGIDGLFLLEINTQPGMTPTSLSPEQAKEKGISFDSFMQLDCGGCLLQQMSFFNLRKEIRRLLACGINSLDGCSPL